MVAVCGRLVPFPYLMMRGGNYHVVEPRIFQTLLGITYGEIPIYINDESGGRFEVLLTTVAVILPLLLLGIYFSVYEAVVACGEGFRQIRHRGSLGLISDRLGCI